MSQETRRRGDGGGAFGVGAALVEVAHQQIGAAGVAEFADLGQQPGHRDLVSAYEFRYPGRYE
jgi:hypothetical protein